MAMETEEFRRLIETHQRMVFSLALRIAGEYGTAEEVAQDVLVALHRSGEGLESEDHVRFWLRAPPYTERPLVDLGKMGSGMGGMKPRQ